MEKRHLKGLAFEINLTCAPLRILDTVLRAWPLEFLRLSVGQKSHATLDLCQIELPSSLGLFSLHVLDDAMVPEDAIHFFFKPNDHKAYPQKKDEKQGSDHWADAPNFTAFFGESGMGLPIDFHRSIPKAPIFNVYLMRTVVTFNGSTIHVT